MKYIIREIMYSLILMFYKIKYRHLIVGFRAKIAYGSQFEGYNKISHHAYFSGKMGYSTYIGEYSNVIGKIGRYCSIGGNVVFLCSTHPVEKYVSTAPCFYSTLKQNGFSYINKQKFNEFPKYKNSEFPIIVGNDVYIGYGARIIAPLRIGDGAVIAANSVVTHDVEPFTIVGGSPAKVIKKRFADEDIAFLNKINWWDKDPEWLRKHADLFEDIDKLKKLFETDGEMLLEID